MGSIADLRLDGCGLARADHLSLLTDQLGLQLAAWGGGGGSTQVQVQVQVQVVFCVTGTGTSGPSVP